LSEFQQELVTIAKSLKIKFGMSTTEERLKQSPRMTIGEASFFIQDAVRNFMYCTKASSNLRQGGIRKLEWSLQL
jgi:hypothetical protein